MRIVGLTTSGRFPTVVFDPGTWWGTVARRHDAVRFSLNDAWWRVLCGGPVESILLSALPWRQRILQRAHWALEEIDLKQTAQNATTALDRLCTSSLFQSAADYIEAVDQVSSHLNALNRAQSELEFGIGFGVRVRGLDYSDSRALAAYSEKATIFSSLIEHGLSNCPREIDLLTVSITCAEDLLSAFVAVKTLQKVNPSMHACLADHGYENFSLHGHIEKLKNTGALASVFDTVISYHDDRDPVMRALANALEANAAPKGFLTRESLPVTITAPETHATVPPVPIFAPEPILWTRVSDQRCYWNRCTFCVQNSKFQRATSPSLKDLSATLDRLEAQVAAGYHNIIFSDEALSPSLLRSLCEGIVSRGLQFRWACRCKLEKEHTSKLFALMRAAGCYEILYGLESTSPNVQKLMDKHSHGVDDAWTKSVFEAMRQADIGTHVNMIAGFPGETREELKATVDFVADAIADVRNATFTLNRFAVFPDTPVFKDPQRFGIEIMQQSGDMPSRYAYRYLPHLQAAVSGIDEQIPELEELLFDRLGWTMFGKNSAAREAIILYFSSGHGSIFKAAGATAFANPLQYACSGSAVA